MTDTGYTGHTPGPWKLCHHLRSPEGDKQCPCGYRGGIWGGDGEHIVCEIGPTIVPGQEGLEGGRYPREVELANARLIAAAPDLLESGKPLLPYVKIVFDDGYISAEELEAFRAAISKATGAGE